MDSCGLAAVVRMGYFLEPGVLECLLGSYPASWIVDKDLGEEVEEELEKFVVRGDCFLMGWS